MAHTTLTMMARGGMYDQVGGGFHRYSVDAHWLVPHFEKMLYDNGQLASLYLHGWLALGDPECRRVCEDTLDYILREMTDPAGGFYSAQDADSEGHEGKFFVWSEQELREVLGTDAERAGQYWGVDRGTNFEGQNILYLAGEPDAERIAPIRTKLYEARARRVHPLRDDAVRCGTSVAAETLFRLAVLTGESRYEAIAAKALRPMADLMARYASGFGRFLCALDFHLGPVVEIALVASAAGDGLGPLVSEVFGRYLPNRVVAGMVAGEAGHAAGIPLLTGREAVGGRPTAYVCRNYACELPVTDRAGLARQLDQA